MRKTFLWIILTVLHLEAEETDRYTVYFWKIPCLRITMTVSDDPSRTGGEVSFRTRTEELFSYFFSVDNSYTTVFDRETFQMIRYEKTVKQPNVEQELTISWDSAEKTYVVDEKRYERPVGTHNIFSLLLRGRATDREVLDTQWWDADHEGRLFRSRYLWIDSTDVQVGGKPVPADHYRLDFVPGDGEEVDLVDVTDIFTWGIAQDGGVRQIWIERGGKRRILRGEVKVRGFTLVAELKDD